MIEEYMVCRGIPFHRMRGMGYCTSVPASYIPLRRCLNKSTKTSSWTIPHQLYQIFIKKKYNQDPIHQLTVIVSGEDIGSPRLSPLCSVHIESHASSDTSASLTNQYFPIHIHFMQNSTCKC